MVATTFIVTVSAAQRQQHIAKTRALNAPKSGNVVATAPAVVAYLDDVDTLSDDEAPIMAFTVAHDVALLPPSVLLLLYLDDTQQTDDLPISAFTAARGISIPNP